MTYKPGDITTVTVTVGEGLSSAFACPDCESRIRFSNKYPYGWMWKVCPKCRVQWTNLSLNSEGIGPHREWDDLEAGTTGEVRVLRGNVIPVHRHR